MKILLQILIILLFFGCGNIDKLTKKPALVNLVVKQDKYSLILKHHFDKNFKTYDRNSSNFSVETNLTFNTISSLSNRGSNNLNVIKGTVKFRIFDKLKAKLINSGSISTSINTGNILSLYGIDENNNYTKERISKYLASKLYKKVILNIRHSEN